MERGRLERGGEEGASQGEEGGERRGRGGRREGRGGGFKRERGGLRKGEGGASKRGGRGFERGRQWVRSEGASKGGFKRLPYLRRPSPHPPDPPPNPPSAEPPSTEPPKISLFFFFFPLLGVFSWNFGGVLKRRALKCPRLEFSGCRVKPRRLQSRSRPRPSGPPFGPHPLNHLGFGPPPFGVHRSGPTSGPPLFGRWRPPPPPLLPETSTHPPAETSPPLLETPSCPRRIGAGGGDGEGERVEGGLQVEEG